ncbi:MAG: amino acid permease [Chitinophagaceae bacterium]|nr:amino acid permease [Chitinophagaceae bacterium]
MENNKESFHRSLSLLDGSLLVIGSMIGSGIFIVSADIARNVGSAGWLIAVWLISGFITLSAALSYGELSGMFPKAGGQYVYLREAFGKLFGFLYGWSFFAVIQTGTIAAVGVAFAKYTGHFFPELGDENILMSIGGFNISAAQVLGIASIGILTYINSRGVENGKWIQFFFTFAKIAALVGLIIFGLLLFDGGEWSANWANGWDAMKLDFSSGSMTTESITGFALVAGIGVAMVGGLFSSDAWNNVTFIAGEIKRPERNIGLSLFIGTMVVTILYVCMNLMYLNTLTIAEIGNAPSDRIAVAAAEKMFSTGMGAAVIAGLIMVSTFGCNNGLIMSGARVYYTMARDGYFLPSAGKLNKKGVPSKALWMQFIWASVLCLSGTYGQLLDYLIFTALLFYILTIVGIFKLRRTMPDHPRPYKAFGYPIIPIVYIIMASLICVVLIINKIENVGPGLLIVLLGVPVYYYLKKRGLKVDD